MAIARNLLEHASKPYKAVQVMNKCCMKHHREMEALAESGWLRHWSLDGEAVHASYCDDSYAIRFPEVPTMYLGNARSRDYAVARCDRNYRLSFSSILYPDDGSLGLIS